MSTHHCCKALAGDPARKAAAVPAPATARLNFARRCKSHIRSVAAGVMLILMPKCPACLAAYISVGTGIGVSFATAKYLRILLVTLCVATLSYAAVKRLRRFISMKKQGMGTLPVEDSTLSL